MGYGCSGKVKLFLDSFILQPFYNTQTTTTFKIKHYNSTNNRSFLFRAEEIKKRKANKTSQGQPHTPVPSPNQLDIKKLRISSVKNQNHSGPKKGGLTKPEIEVLR